MWDSEIWYQHDSDIWYRFRNGRWEYICTCDPDDCGHDTLGEWTRSIEYPFPGPLPPRFFPVEGVGKTEPLYYIDEGL